MALHTRGHRHADLRIPLAANPHRAAIALALGAATLSAGDDRRGGAVPQPAGCADGTATSSRCRRRQVTADLTGVSLGRLALRSVGARSATMAGKAHY